MIFSDGIEELAKFLRSRYRKKPTAGPFVYPGPEPEHDRHINLSIGWSLSEAGLAANDDQNRDWIEVALIAAFRLGCAEGMADQQERIDEKEKLLDAYSSLLDSKEVPL